MNQARAVRVIAGEGWPRAYVRVRARAEGIAGLGGRAPEPGPGLSS